MEALNGARFGEPQGGAHIPMMYKRKTIGYHKRKHRALEYANIIEIGIMADCRGRSSRAFTGSASYRASVHTQFRSSRLWLHTGSFTPQALNMASRADSVVSRAFANSAAAFLSK